MLLSGTSTKYKKLHNRCLWNNLPIVLSCISTVRAFVFVDFFFLFEEGSFPFPAFHCLRGDRHSSQRGLDPLILSVMFCWPEGVAAECFKVLPPSRRLGTQLLQLNCLQSLYFWTAIIQTHTKKNQQIFINRSNLASGGAPLKKTYHPPMF